MEEKSSKKEKLDPLPESGDEFWKHADVNVIRLKETKSCEHNFVRTRGVEAQCVKCGAGFWLGPGFEVKSGHIYKHGELVV